MMLRLTRPTFTLAKTRTLVAVNTHVRYYAKEKEEKKPKDDTIVGGKKGGDAVGKKKVTQKRLSYTPNDLPAQVQQKIVNQMQGEIVAKYTNILMRRQAEKGDVMEASKKRIVVTEADYPSFEEREMQEESWDRALPPLDELMGEDAYDENDPPPTPEEIAEEERVEFGMLN